MSNVLDIKRFRWNNQTIEPLKWHFQVERLFTAHNLAIDERRVVLVPPHSEITKSLNH